MAAVTRVVSLLLSSSKSRQEASTVPVSVTVPEQISLTLQGRSDELERTHPEGPAVGSSFGSDGVTVRTAI